jgi:hypothetical protein
MERHIFMETLKSDTPPEGLEAPLKSLWYDKKGQWEKAHALVQDEEDSTSELIHAYLHRKEGDLFNADYWYRRSGRKRPNTSLEEEWLSLITELTL